MILHEVLSLPNFVQKFAKFAKSPIALDTQLLLLIQKNFA